MGAGNVEQDVKRLDGEEELRDEELTYWANHGRHAAEAEEKIDRSIQTIDEAVLKWGLPFVPIGEGHSRCLELMASIIAYEKPSSPSNVPAAEESDL
jgi:hypothetical protein